MQKKGIKLAEIYDTCNGQCKVNDPGFIIFDENLSLEINRPKLVNLIELLLDNNGLSYAFSDDEIDKITEFALLNSRKKQQKNFYGN